MNRKSLSLLAAFLCALILLTLPACEIQQASGSVKTLTKPYINTYECVEARLGKRNLLESHEYIKITLLDDETLEVCFKPKNGKKKAFTGGYSVDNETGEFSGEIGILGYKFRESAYIKDGGFTITRTFMGMPLFMKFKAQ